MGINLGEMPHPRPASTSALDRFWSGVNFFAFVALPVAMVMAAVVFVAAALL